MANSVFSFRAKDLAKFPLWAKLGTRLLLLLLLLAPTPAAPNLDEDEEADVTAATEDEDAAILALPETVVAVVPAATAPVDDTSTGSRFEDIDFSKRELYNNVSEFDNINSSSNSHSSQCV